VSLAAATPIPEGFSGRNFHNYRSALRKKIDCSVIELMANQGTASKKSLKGPGSLMGGSNHV
jgi:hypothetical protein